MRHGKRGPEKTTSHDGALGSALVAISRCAAASFSGIKTKRDEFREGAAGRFISRSLEFSAGPTAKLCKRYLHKGRFISRSLGFSAVRRPDVPRAAALSL